MKKPILLLIVIFIAFILSTISRLITTNILHEDNIYSNNSLQQIDNSILFWFLGLSLFVFVMP